MACQLCGRGWLFGVRLRVCGGKPVCIFNLQAVLQPLSLEAVLLRPFYGCSVVLVMHACVLFPPLDLVLLQCLAWGSIPLTGSGTDAPKS